MNRFSGGAVDCLLCGAVEETVEHFVVECGGLRGARERCGVGRSVGVGETLLFEGSTEEKYTRTLDEMRKRLMELGERTEVS